MLIVTKMLSLKDNLGKNSFSEDFYKAVEL